MQDYKDFFINYKTSVSKLLNEVDSDLINQSVLLINKAINSKGKVYLVGNGGSASIASHVSVDFTKSAGIKSSTFNNPNIITCLANDYGYENWVTEAIKAYCSKNDLIIIISSSGKSLNMVNAAKYCHSNNYDLITLTGFDKDNEVHKLGKVNFFVDSNEYNFVEMIHHIILVSISDIYVKKNT